MWCLFHSNDTYKLSPRVPCLYWHSYYLSSASLGQGEIIGLLVVQYEMFWDINTSPLFFLELRTVYREQLPKAIYMRRKEKRIIRLYIYKLNRRSFQLRCKSKNFEWSNPFFVKASIICLAVGIHAISAISPLSIISLRIPISILSLLSRISTVECTASYKQELFVLHVIFILVGWSSSINFL